MVGWMLALLVLISLLPVAHAASARGDEGRDTPTEQSASAQHAQDETPYDPGQHRELPAKKSRLTSLHVQDAPVLHVRHRPVLATPRARRPDVHAGRPSAGDALHRLRPDPSLRLHPGQAPPRAA